jgi:hypothetical protein
MLSSTDTITSSQDLTGFKPGLVRVTCHEAATKKGGHTDRLFCIEGPSTAHLNRSQAPPMRRVHTSLSHIVARDFVRACTERRRICYRTFDQK